MTYLKPAISARCGGRNLKVLECQTSHSVDAPVGQASVVIALPLPAEVLLGAKMEITANNGVRGATIFTGEVRRIEETIMDSGLTATLQCDGWNYIMAWRDFQDFAFTGPISATNVIKSLYSYRAIGDYTAVEVDTVDDIAGAEIMLGGNTAVEAGEVVVPEGTSFLDMCTRIAYLFGYKVYDSPDGTCRVSAVRGLPGASDHTFTEGTNLMDGTGVWDVRPIVTYWRVNGASGTEEVETGSGEGVEFAYTSYPAIVPSNPYIKTPPGATYGEVSDELLVSDALCEKCRNVQEINHSAVYQEVMFSSWGQPQLQPGQVVTIDAPSVDLDGVAFWLMSVNHQFTADGYWTSMTGWRGSGSALPGADNCTEDTVAAGPYHIGDESISWYAVQTATTTSHPVLLTLADHYASLTICGKGHGINSYYVDGGEVTANAPSRLEIWSIVPAAEIAEVQLPVMQENYESQLDYGTDDTVWEEFCVTLPGEYDADTYQLRFISGFDSRAVAGPYDDFEIKDLTISQCTPGEPVIPGQPTDPPPVIPVPPEDGGGGGPPVTCSGIAGPGGTVPSGMSASSVIIVSGFSWPAGYAYMKVEATIGPMTGKRSYYGANPLDDPAQSISVTYTSAGWTGYVPWKVPGTQTPSDPHTGTPFTGTGTAESIFYMNPAVGLGVDWIRAHQRTDQDTGRPGYTVSDVCVTFYN